MIWLWAAKNVLLIFFLLLVMGLLKCSWFMTTSATHILKIWVNYSNSTDIWFCIHSTAFFNRFFLSRTCLHAHQPNILILYTAHTRNSFTFVLFYLNIVEQNKRPKKIENEKKTHSFVEQHDNQNEQYNTYVIIIGFDHSRFSYESVYFYYYLY